MNAAFKLIHNSADSAVDSCVSTQRYEFFNLCVKMQTAAASVNAALNSKSRSKIVKARKGWWGRLQEFELIKISRQISLPKPLSQNRRIKEVGVGRVG